jgi:hypothetical protein
MLHEIDQHQLSRTRALAKSMTMSKRSATPCVSSAPTVTGDHLDRHPQLCGPIPTARAERQVSNGGADGVVGGAIRMLSEPPGKVLRPLVCSPGWALTKIILFAARLCEY